MCAPLGAPPSWRLGSALPTRPAGSRRSQQETRTTIRRHDHNPGSSMTAAGTAGSRKPGMGDVLRAFRQPKVAVMLALGFSSGLPFLLTAGTLGYWLRDEGIDLKTIGFLSWVGLAYSLKFLWSPLIDRTDVPLAGRLLGRRRGWMLAAQLVVGSGLLAMALTGPKSGLAVVGVAALAVAFASSTQDVVVDAWRIE